MRWDGDYSYKIYGCEIDVKSWGDKVHFGIVNCSVTKQADDLRYAADINVQDYSIDKEVWVRVYMDVSQNGNSEHVPVFTGLATSPSRNRNGDIENAKLECYSVLKPCADVLLMRGWYAPAYRSVKKIFNELLEPCPAPVTFDDDLPTLTTYMLAEDNESNLSMIDKILNALNLVMRVDGSGRIHIGRQSLDTAAVFSANGFDIIQPEVEISNDWYSCPNVYVAINEELTAIARDDKEDSPLSTVSRGREIWAMEDSIDLGEDETLAEYARRMLKEKQKVVETIKYKRAFLPDIEIGDTVKLRYKDLNGLYTIISQQYTLGENVTEEVARVEQN